MLKIEDKYPPLNLKKVDFQSKQIIAQTSNQDECVFNGDENKILSLLTVLIKKLTLISHQQDPKQVDLKDNELDYLYCLQTSQKLSGPETGQLALTKLLHQLRMPFLREKILKLINEDLSVDQIKQKLIEMIKIEQLKPNAFQKLQNTVIDLKRKYAKYLDIVGLEIAGFQSRETLKIEGAARKEELTVSTEGLTKVLDQKIREKADLNLRRLESRLIRFLKIVKDQEEKQQIMVEFARDMQALVAGDPKLQARLNHIFARLYMWELQDYPKAREYNDKVLAQEPVLTADAPGFEIVVKSKLIEAQLFDKEKNYAQAEAALLEMEKMLQGKNMPDLLIEAYQNLGDLYNWQLKDEEQARENYELALKLAAKMKEGLEKNQRTFDLKLAQGDSYRKSNYTEQCRYYDEAQKMLDQITPGKSQKLGQLKLKIRYTEAYANLKRPEAYGFWKDAQALISASGLPKADLAQFDDTLLGIRDMLAGQLTSRAAVSLGYQDETFNGMPTTETQVRLDAEFEILAWLRLAGSLTASDVSQGYKVSDKSVYDRLNTVEWDNLDNFSASLDPRLTFKPGDDWILKVNPGFTLSRTGYIVSQYDWDEYGKTCVDDLGLNDPGCQDHQVKNRKDLWTTLARFETEAAWRFAQESAAGDWSLYAKPIFAWLHKNSEPGIEANSMVANEEISVLQKSYDHDQSLARLYGQSAVFYDRGYNPYTFSGPWGIANNGVDDRLDEIDKLKQEEAKARKQAPRKHLFKAGGELGVRLYSPVSLGNGWRLGISTQVGMRAEYDEIGATRYGFWLVPEATWAKVKLAGALGLGLDFAHKGGAFIKLDLSGEAGSYYNANGRLEAGYKHPRFQLSGGGQGNLYHQTYQDENDLEQAVDSKGLTGFLEIKF